MAGGCVLGSSAEEEAAVEAGSSSSSPPPEVGVPPRREDSIDANSITLSLFGRGQVSLRVVLIAQSFQKGKDFNRSILTSCSAQTVKSKQRFVLFVRCMKLKITC